MAITLTDRASDSASHTVIKPSLVLEIDGYESIYGIGNIVKYRRVGDVGLYVDGSWVIGDSSLTTNNANSQYISIDGTTQSISQQLQQDKGGATSITSIQVSLIDKDEAITRLISPGFELEDVMGRKCWVWLGFQETAFPEDYILLFAGIIDEVTASGNITLNIAHPEQKKRQEIFVSIETTLNGAITDSQTTITLDSTANLILPYSTEVFTYVKIDDEIIRYTGITGNDITGCIRAQFGTIAVAHDDEASVASFYRITEDSINMALKIMLSGPDEYYATLGVDNFVRSASGTNVANSIFFAGVNVETKYGLTVGDFITTTGASQSSNNNSLMTVSSIDITDDGSVVTITGATLVLELASSATASFKSKYNVWPDGLGLGGDQVDVAEYERLSDLFTSRIPTMDFYLTDTVKAKDFIDKEVLYPANLFTLPRKGKISCGVISPPLAIALLPQINKTNITNPESIRIKRSLGKYFYNTVIYKYDFDAVETDLSTAGYIKVDEDSKARIPVGTKALVITSKGLRNNTATTQILDANSDRTLERYKFAAETIQVSVFYGVGFNIDVGDVVYFGDDDLNIVDTALGERGFAPRLCEVVDKKMNIVTGRVDLTLVDTNYNTTGRYGIFSPSSMLASGSTTTQLVIQNSYGTTAPEIEKDKWVDYIGEDILIHDITYSTTYTATILGFDPSDDTIMRITTIGSPPPAGYIIDIINYPSSSDPTESLLYKSIHCFSGPQVAVTSGVSATQFSVGAGDISKFFVGSQILVHNDDYSSVSNEVYVESIVGTTITTRSTLGLTPTSSYLVDLIGFSADQGSAYRYL